MVQEKNHAMRLAQKLARKTPFTKLVLGPEAKTNAFMKLVERELHDTTQPNLSTLLFTPININRYDVATRATEGILESIVEVLSEYRPGFRIRWIPKEYRRRTAGDISLGFIQLAMQFFCGLPRNPAGLLNLLQETLKSRNLHIIVVIKGIDEFAGYHETYESRQRNVDPILSLLYYLEKKESISTVITSSAGLNVDPKLFLHETVQIG